jgi:hypothetical protein
MHQRLLIVFALASCGIRAIVAPQAAYADCMLIDSRTGSHTGAWALPDADCLAREARHSHRSHSLSEVRQIKPFVLLRNTLLTSERHSLALNTNCRARYDAFERKC